MYREQGFPFQVYRLWGDRCLHLLNKKGFNCMIVKTTKVSDDTNFF